MRSQMDRKQYDSQSRRYFKEKRELTFDDVMKGDVPTIFTPLQHKLIGLYRDGAVNDIIASQKMNISPNTEVELKRDVIFRMDRAFGRAKGKERFQRAVGVAIIAGWIEPKNSDVTTSHLENNIVDLMLYGFSRKEISEIILMERRALRARIESIEERVGVGTDIELVAIRASEFRKRLIAVRNLG